MDLTPYGKPTLGRAAFPQGLENPRRVFHSSTAVVDGEVHFSLIWA